MNTRSRQYAHFTRVSPNLDEPTQPPKEAHRGPGPNGERYTQFVSSQEKYQCTRTRRLARMSTHFSSTSTQAATDKSLGTMSRGPRTQSTSTATSSSSQQSMRCVYASMEYTRVSAHLPIAAICLLDRGTRGWPVTCILLLRHISLHMPPSCRRVQVPLNRCSLVDCREAADWFSWPQQTERGLLRRYRQAGTS